jgi:hypothetical protein
VIIEMKSNKNFLFLDANPKEGEQVMDYQNRKCLKGIRNLKLMIRVMG